MGQQASCSSCRPPHAPDIVAISSSSSSTSLAPKTIARETRGSSVWRFLSEQAKGQPQQAAVLMLQWMLEKYDLDVAQREDVQQLLEVVQQLSVENGGIYLSEEQKQLADILDHSSRDYLLKLSGASMQQTDQAKGKMKKASSAVLSAVRMKSVAKRFRESTGNGVRAFEMYAASEAVAMCLSNVSSWTDFDVFKLNVASEDRALQFVSAEIFSNRNLMSIFGFKEAKVQHFLTAVAAAYRDNPYHSALHAADVTQTVHVMLRLVQSIAFAELEQLALFFSAICHDVGHPGVTNDFRVASSDEDAMTYNDMSVNENMHCALAYRLLLMPDNNFVDSLSEKQRLGFRKLVVQIILATDMAHHFVKVKSLSALLKEKPSVGSWDSVSPALEMLLHGADISNVCKPQAIALRWTDRVLQEFFQQGDLELGLGRPVSPLCDRATVCKASSQVGFISFIVQPMFEAMRPMCTLDVPIQLMQEYKQFWQNEKEKPKHQMDGKRLKEIDEMCK